MQTFGHTPIESNLCIAGHNLNTFISQRLFNGVAKKLVKDITNSANRETDASAAKRKRKYVNYGCLNNILSVLGTGKNEVTAVHLVRAYCIPTYTYEGSVTAALTACVMADSLSL